MYASAHPIASRAKVLPKVVVKKTPEKVKPRPTPNKAPEKPASELAKIADTKVLRRAILVIIKSNPDLVVSNQVNTGALSLRLQSEYPQLSYKACGSKTLGAFLRDHCALAVLKNQAVQVPVPTIVVPKSTTLPAPIPTTGVPTPSRKFLVHAVRKQFTDGALGPDVRATGPAGLKLSLIGSKLRAAIPGFSSPNDGLSNGLLGRSPSSPCSWGQGLPLMGCSGQEHMAGGPDPLSGDSLDS